MRTWVWLPLFLLVSSCQTAHKKMDACNSIGRHPASLACEGAYKNSNVSIAENQEKKDTETLRVEPANFTRERSSLTPTQAAVEAAIDQLANYGKDGDRWKYIETVEAHSRMEVKVGSDEKVSLGKELLARRTLKESTAVIMTRLGYKEQYGYLMPPRNQALLYKNLYVAIVESALKAGISSSDIILPALGFTHNVTRQVYFASPGIDKLPDPKEWRLMNSSEELNAEQFSKMIEDRKLLLDAFMMSHDIGHHIDLIERPQYHVLFRNYVVARATFFKNFKDHPGIKNFRSYDRFVDQVVNEWVYLPNAKNLSTIKKVIPKFEQGKNSSFEDLKTKYRSLDQASILLISQNFFKFRYQLFDKHGGGARDTSYDRFKVDRYHRDYIDRLENKTKEKFSMDYDIRDSITHFLKYEAPALFERIQKLLSSNPDRYVLRAIITAAKHIEKEGDLDAGKHELLAVHLAEVEYRIHQALNNDMTPEQFVKDITEIFKPGGMKKYLQSVTYKYFSTYPVGSLPRVLFVERYGDIEN